MGMSKLFVQKIVGEAAHEYFAEPYTQKVVDGMAGFIARKTGAYVSIEYDPEKFVSTSEVKGIVDVGSAIYKFSIGIGLAVSME